MLQIESILFAHRRDVLQLFTLLYPRLDSDALRKLGELLSICQIDVGPQPLAAVLADDVTLQWGLSQRVIENYISEI
jgi:hypothetical protein